MRTVAIVQARLGSQRLPGKVLKDLCGRPLLDHVVERLRRAKRLDEVVLAIPDDKRDDVLAIFCEQRRYPVFRGPEGDVLARYAQTARAFRADVVVRITSDCPLIDAELVDTIVERHAMARINDYTCNVLVRTFPRGLDTEVLSMDCLRRLDREALKNQYREHVTTLIHDDPQAFKTENVSRPQGDRSDLRLCVDTPDDFALVESVLTALGPHGGVEEVIAFLDKNPAIASLNANVKQKTTK